ncbi:MAG: RHS repeat-associated core domain-containing protein [Spirochaetia bacterium]|nr:RHS repeat-associated core domain-containing protein [Spirochaetia bacterium]
MVVLPEPGEDPGAGEEPEPPEEDPGTGQGEEGGEEEPLPPSGEDEDGAEDPPVAQPDPLVAEAVELLELARAELAEAAEALADAEPLERAALAEAVSAVAEAGATVAALEEALELAEAEAQRRKAEEEAAAAAAASAAAALAAKQVGDPVSLATGAFRHAERDAALRYGLLEASVSRAYSSDSPGSLSFGPGWTSPVDARVVRGFDSGAAAEAARLEAARDALRTRLESAAAEVAAAEGRVARARAALETARGRVEAAWLAAARALDAARRADSDSAEALGCRDLALARLAAIDGPEGGLATLGSAALELEAIGGGLEDARELFAALEEGAAAARFRSDLSAANRAANRASGFDDDAWAGRLGTGRFALVDEAGAIHLYRALREASTSSGARHPDGSVNYRPSGSALEALGDGGEELELLDNGAFLRRSRDGTRRWYDFRGALLGVEDREGHRLIAAWGARGLSSLRDGTGRSLALEREPASGRVLSSRDAIGRVWTYGYDGAGRLSAVRDPSGARTRFGYEGTLLVSLTRDDGSTRRFRYGTLGDRRVLVETEDEEGAVERFRYEPDGRTAEYENPSGIVERHRFDEGLRTVRVEYSDGSFAGFEYDGAGRLVKERKADGGEWRYAYDEAGNRISAKGPEGWSEAYAYDAFGLVTLAVDSLGARTVFERDGAGRLLSVRRPGGALESYEYDEGGLLAAYVDPNGARTTYSYDAWENLAAVLRPDGSTERFERDAAGRVLGHVDSEGFEWRYELDADDRVVKVVDPAGGVATRAYSKRKDLVAETDRAGATTRYYYDRRHLLVLSVDGAGVARGFEYRADGRPVLERTGMATLAEGASGESSADWIVAWERATELAYDGTGRLSLERIAGTDLMTAYEHDALGRVAAKTDGAGIRTVYERDGLGRPLSESVDGVTTWRLDWDAANRPLSAFDALGNETRFDYGADGLLAVRTRYVGGRLASEDHYEWDSVGRLVARIDPLGRRYYRSFDALGRLVAEGGPSREYGERVFAWDRRSLPVEIVERSGLTTRFEYDATGELVAAVDPSGARELFRRDAEGRVIERVDRSGGVWLFERDGAGRVVAETDPTGATTRFELDASGRVLAELDALGGRAEHRRDPAGRVSLEIDPSGVATERAWDAAGNLLEVRKGSALVESLSWNSSGQLVGRFDGAVIHEYVRDAAGNLVAEGVEGGSFRRYSYDASGNLLSETDRLGKTASYEYDAAGRLVERRDFDGRATRFEYDGLDRVVAEYRPDGDVARYAWDPDGRLVAASDKDSSLEFRYDAAGNLASSVDAKLGVETEYGYDSSGRRTSLALGALSLGWKLDAAGRIVELRDASGGTTTLVRDALGRVTSMEYPNGARVETAYDGAGRPVKVERSTRQRGQDAKLPSGTYAYDDAGRLVRADDTLFGISEYGYDAAGRLASVVSDRGGELVDAALAELERFGVALDPGAQATRGGSAGGKRADAGERDFTVRYSYDASGRRAEKSTPFGTIAYAYDAEGRVLSVGRRAYASDANGNLVSETLDGSVRSYAYDSSRRLVRVTEIETKGKGGKSETVFSMNYGYDALGRRVSRTEEGGSGSGDDSMERYLRDGLGMDLLASWSERHGAGALAGMPDAVFDRVDGAALAATWSPGAFWQGEPHAGTGAEYYVNDAARTVRAALDRNGTVIDAPRYDAFGMPLNDEAGRSSPLGFAGTALDPDTGLRDFGFRDYAPELGRFTTADPARDGDDWFAFCMDDPVNFAELFGLSAEELYLQQAHMAGGGWVADYPVACKVFSAYNALLAEGYRPLDLPGDRAERMNDALMDGKKNIAEIVAAEFGLEIVREAIPAGLSLAEFEAFVAGRPAVVHFNANDYWGSNKLDARLEHGITYSDGAFRDSYTGRGGVGLESTRGGKAAIDFRRNLGGWVYYLRKKEEP